MKKIFFILLSFCLVGCSLNKSSQEKEIYTKVVEGLQQLDTYQSAKLNANITVDGILDNATAEGSFIKDEKYEMEAIVYLNTTYELGGVYYLDDYLYIDTLNKQYSYHIPLNESIFSLLASALAIDSVITSYSSSKNGDYNYYTIALNETIINNLLNLYVSDHSQMKFEQISMSLIYNNDECVGIKVDSVANVNNNEYTSSVEVLLSQINSNITINFPDFEG